VLLLGLRVLTELLHPKSTPYWKGVESVFVQENYPILLAFPLVT
jgi:hypothetical protein